MNDLIIEIMKIALVKNKRDKNTIFVDFAGHVNWLSIQVNKNGWKPNSEGEPDLDEKIQLDKDTAEKQLKEVLEYLKNLED